MEVEEVRVRGAHNADDSLWFLDSTAARRKRFYQFRQFLVGNLNFNGFKLKQCRDKMQKQAVGLENMTKTCQLRYNWFISPKTTQYFTRFCHSDLISALSTTLGPSVSL